MSAIYRLNNVIRIKGERRKTKVELLVDVVVTAKLPGLIFGQAKVESRLGGMS